MKISHFIKTLAYDLVSFVVPQGLQTDNVDALPLWAAICIVLVCIVMLGLLLLAVYVKFIS